MTVGYGVPSTSSFNAYALGTQVFNNTNMGNSVYALATQPFDNSIVIGGAFAAINGVTRNYLARVTLTGLLDTSFSTPTNVNNQVYALALQPSDGSILLG